MPEPRLGLNAPRVTSAQGYGNDQDARQAAKDPEKQTHSHLAFCISRGYELAQGCSQHGFQQLLRVRNQPGSSHLGARSSLSSSEYVSAGMVHGSTAAYRRAKCQLICTLLNIADSETSSTPTSITDATWRMLSRCSYPYELWIAFPKLRRVPQKPDPKRLDRRAKSVVVSRQTGSVEPPGQQQSGLKLDRTIRKRIMASHTNPRSHSETSQSSPARLDLKHILKVGMQCFDQHDAPSRSFRAPGSWPQASSDTGRYTYKYRHIRSGSRNILLLQDLQGAPCDAIRSKPFQARPIVVGCTSAP